MKKQTRYIVLAATLAVCAIVCYQSYWLVDIYRTLQANLERDIQEAMRASDFEEMTHRVAILRDEQIGGKMSIKVGVNDSRDSAVVSNEYTDRETLEAKESAPQSLQSNDSANKDESGTDNQMAFDDFANALRTAEDVMKVGMQMQRGVHQGLDQLKPICPAYYDSILTCRLDSLGVTGTHVSLYLLLPSFDESIPSDTLYRNTSNTLAQADTFRLVLDVEGHQQYVLLTPRSIFSLPRQMYAPIFFSLFTLLILIVAFWYIINMLKRMWALDEIKSDFTNNITHELKTPIAVAYAASDALLHHGDLSDTGRVRKYLSICQEQLSLLTKLVEQILSMSMERRENMLLNIEPLEVLPIVEKVTGNHKLKNSKKVEFSISIPPQLCVHADKMHFTNIINNLVDNAIKYSDENVHIVINAITDNSGGCTISVTDNGIGIPSESQRFIFDRFYRVPHGNLHDVKGYGLGLYYVKSLMNRFGGSVSLSSELGQGSTFRLHFPQ